MRPISESALNAFGQVFVRQDWNYLDEFTDPTEMVLAFEGTMTNYVDNFFPLKKITVSIFDKPFFTEELRALRRRRQRNMRNMKN